MYKDFIFEDPKLFGTWTTCMDFIYEELHML